MKWVSWATWAGEIFSKIVRTLEKPWNKPEEAIIKKKWINYLEITSPLSWSKFKINRYISKDIQQIILRYTTSLKHDSHYWILDWNRIYIDSLNLTKWHHNLILKVLSSTWVLESDEVYFDVEDDTAVSN